MWLGVNYTFKEQSAEIRKPLCVCMRVCPRIRTSPSSRTERIWAILTGMAACPSTLCLAWVRSHSQHGATVNALAWHAICLSGHSNPLDYRGEDKHTTLLCFSLMKEKESALKNKLYIVPFKRFLMFFFKKSTKACIYLNTVNLKEHFFDFFWFFF